VSVIIHAYVSKSHSACRNHSVRVETAVVSVVITFARVKITLYVEIKLCVWKSHTACINHTRVWRYHTRECQIHTHTCQNYSRVYGNHTLRVKSYSACSNQSCAWWNHTRACSKSHFVWKLHSACWNHTLRVVVIPVSVIFTRIRVKITLIFTRIRVKITLVCGNHTLGVKSHSAGRNYSCAC
jgi:hypothetical protein